MDFTTNLPLNFIICIHNARKQPTIKHRHPCPFDVVRQHSMMGIDSEGMLISAVHEEDSREGLHLLMVDPHIPAGAKLY